MLSPTRSIRSARFGVALAALSLAASAALLPAPADAQQRPASTQRAQPSPAAAMEFAETPLRVPALGLTMWLPVGSRIDASSIMGADNAFRVFAPDNTWMIRGFSPSSRDRDLTPEEIVDSLVQGLLSPGEVTDEIKEQWDVEVGVEAATLLARENGLTIAGLPSARFYARVRRNDASEAVTGYTVKLREPGKFVVYELTCPAPEYEKARAAFETILAAASYRDPLDAAEERAAGVLAADQALARLNRSDFEAMFDAEPRYYRLYQPAPGGADTDAQEIAYQRIAMSVGSRGELSPQKPQSRWTAADRQQGYVIRVDGRFLDGRRVVDSRAVYFLTFDRAEEAWTSRMRIRDDQRREQNWTETGVRLGNDIKVTIDQPGAQPQLTQWRRPPEAYASQVEQVLIPRILARLAAPAVFNFYRYYSATGELSLRRDALEPASGGEGWVLRTRPHENATEEISVLDPRGGLVRRVTAQGTVMEPIGFEALKRLWQSKGLPVD